MLPQTRLHFNRYEFKYLLTLAMRQDIESELGHFMTFDPFVEQRQDRRYFVRSLYFDDPHYSAYYDKIDGLHTRSKFRVRTYTRAPSADNAIFLEMKGRTNNRVFKHRAKLANSYYLNPATQRDSSAAEAILKNTETSAVRDQFHFEAQRKRLQPIMVVDYHRRPYISKYDAEFRLTLDEQLRATPSNKLFPPVTESSRSVLRGYTIMEVKFRYHLPAWFHRIIQSYELQRLSISKICKSIEAWQIVPHLE